MTSLSPIRAASPLPSPALDEKTARDFEAVFAGQLAKLMMESVEIDEQFGGGHGEEMFRGILAERLGDEIARRGSFGLKDAVVAQIHRLRAAGQ